MRTITPFRIFITRTLLLVVLAAIGCGDDRMHSPMPEPARATTDDAPAPPSVTQLSPPAEPSQSDPPRDAPVSAQPSTPSPVHSSPSAQAATPPLVTPSMPAVVSPSPTPEAHPPANEQLIRHNPDPLGGLASGAAQRASLCGRGHKDLVARALCSDAKIDSLAALEAALGLVFSDAGALSDPGFALLGHSTSLSAHDVSAINPRAFVFTSLLDDDNGSVVLTFTRGTPFVELAAIDERDQITFYLLKFELACEANDSCKPADLVTPATERNWRGVSLYDDQDLRNTTVDCLQCHQPDGPDSERRLIMLELLPPWTHWLTSTTEGGATLLQDFVDAHGGAEDYAGIPARLLPQVNPAGMSLYVSAKGFALQSNAFASAQIETEVKASAAQQPAVNTPKGVSATWQALYDSASAGMALPPPYHDVKVTDPQKLAPASDSYRALRQGKIAPDALIDIRDVFLDDALADMMFVPAPSASGREVLLQACSQCHNPHLDQSVSRANFDVTRLGAMSDEVKQRAIERLGLPATDIRRMPPTRFRTLSDQAIARAREELDR